MQRLINIQNKLKAPKNQKNSFGGYNYRSAEDILEAVKPLLTEEKCALLLNDDVVLVGDRFYIKATATLFADDGKVIATTTAFARESLVKKGQDDSQITGTASSYARKYALNGLFCIDDTKDADTDEYHKQTTKPVAKSVAEYMGDIDNAETEQEINNLFYEWSKIYVKGTDDYKTLTNKSFERKKQIVGE
jgi:hypothetical protein